MSETQVLDELQTGMDECELDHYFQYQRMTSGYRGSLVSEGRLTNSEHYNERRKMALRFQIER